jgi:hypothetical protein
MSKKIMVTYSIVTQESAEEGESADHGYIDVPTGKYLSMNTQRARAMKARGQSVRTVEEAARFILQDGQPGPSSSQYHHGIFYEFHDYEHPDGEEERAFHPQGFSLSEERRLYDLLMR